MTPNEIDHIQKLGFSRIQSCSHKVWFLQKVPQALTCFIFVLQEICMFACRPSHSHPQVHNHVVPAHIHGKFQNVKEIQK